MGAALAAVGRGRGGQATRAVRGSETCTAALVPTREHRCPRWGPRQVREARALQAWAGQRPLVRFRPQHLCSPEWASLTYGGPSKSELYVAATWAAALSHSLLGAHRNGCPSPGVLPLKGHRPTFPPPKSVYLFSTSFRSLHLVTCPSVSGIPRPACPSPQTLSA